MAIVGYALTQIQREFWPKYALITADGLVVKDSSRTQGMYQGNIFFNGVHTSELH